MNVVAKTWRKRVVIVLLVLVVFDFLFRMIFISDGQTGSSGQKEDVKAAAMGAMVIMEHEQLSQLLSWSDVKPEKKPESQKVTVVKVDKKSPSSSSPPAQPKVDVHQQVANAIKGDKSKYLIKDELLTLKGLFYDGQEFAVVEVENIMTKQVQYFRSTENKALGKHKLDKIGKNHVVVSSGQQKITLYMFGDVSS